MKFEPTLGCPPPSLPPRRRPPASEQSTGKRPLCSMMVDPMQTWTRATHFGAFCTKDFTHVDVVCYEALCLTGSHGNAAEMAVKNDVTGTQASRGETAAGGLP